MNRRQLLRLGGLAAVAPKAIVSAPVAPTAGPPLDMAALYEGAITRYISRKFGTVISLSVADFPTMHMTFVVRELRAAARRTLDEIAAAGTGLR